MVKSLVNTLFVFALLIPTPALGQGFQTDNVRGQFLFSFGPFFSRVEGIPVSVGLRLETVQDDPWRFEGVIVARAEQDISDNLERIGFRSRVEKSLSNTLFRVGVTGSWLVESIEDRGLSDLESSLSGFVFHDDRRDYANRLGGGPYIVVNPPDSPLAAGIQFRIDDYEALEAGGPSSIFKSGLWREQPLVAQGMVRSLVTQIQYDSRPEGDDGSPISAWWARGELTKGIGGDLTNPTVRETVSLMPLPDLPAANSNFTAAEFDVRRYNAIGDVGINFRASGGGSLTDDPLPAQFQHALGGDGTLPGYAPFASDCGARATLVSANDPVLSRFRLFPYYGCDRYVLLQAQVVGYFGFRLGGTNRRNAWQGPGGFNFNVVPQWTVFFDAGRGWTNLDDTFPGVRDEDWRYDVGGGLLIDQLGVFAAYPLEGPNKTVKFVLRLQQRF